MWRQQETHCPGDPLGRGISPITTGDVPLSALEESISGHCDDTVLVGYGLEPIEELKFITQNCDWAELISTYGCT